MYKFWIIAFFIISTNLLAQPQINFPNGTVLDWGIVRPKDHPLNGKLVIKNIGNDTLKIVNVQPTCGCTYAPLTKNILLPDETIDLAITLSISNFEGPISKHIRIYSNDPKHSLMDVELKANIQREVFVTPSNMVSFTDLKVGQTAKQFLNITNKTHKDVKIFVSSVAPSEVQVKIKDGTIIKPGDLYQLEISFTPQQDGILKGRILLQTDNADYPEIPIFIFGDIQKSPLFIGN